MNRLLPFVALAVAPLVAEAQSKPAAKCDLKPSDAWVKRQAEFFDDSKHDWSDDTLRTALLQAAGLAAQRGSTWPTRSVVGAAGVHAVYLLSQSDTGLARNVLHRMMEAGPAESP